MVITHILLNQNFTIATWRIYTSTDSGSKVIEAKDYLH